MGATAKIMAYLGLDASGFKTNIDGAVAKAKSMEVSMRTIKKMTGAMFAVQGFSALKRMLDELKEYQKTSGIRLMSDEDMQQLDSATDSVKRFTMVITAGAATGMSRFVQGWKAFRAGVASGWDANTMAEAIEDIEALDIKAKQLRESIATLEKERFKRDAPGKEQVAKVEAELARLNRDRFLIGKEQKRPGLRESEVKKLENERLENEKARLEVEKELKAAYALQSKDLKAARDLEKQRADEAERAAKAEWDSTKAMHEAADAREKADRAERKLTETLPEGKLGERMGRMNELRQALEDAKTAYARVEKEGAKPGEDTSEFKKRLNDARREVAEREFAILQERKRNRESDRAEAEAEAKKQASVDKQRKRIKEGAEAQKLAISGGNGASARSIEMPGGLQSIGGYFAGADAARRAQADKHARVQEQIMEIEKQMVVELKRLNEGD